MSISRKTNAENRLRRKIYLGNKSFLKSHKTHHFLSLVVLKNTMGKHMSISRKTNTENKIRGKIYLGNKSFKKSHKTNPFLS